MKDFKKVRQKVGKPKRAAANATRVEYRAKAIVMSRQNLREDHGEQVSRRRKLSLADCLSQLGHPSKLTRRDAATELADLLEHHPDVAARATHLPLLVDRLFTCVSDEDRTVRHTVRGILRAHLLAGGGSVGDSGGDASGAGGRVGGGVARIGPFVPRIMAHVTAALTSLHEDVRLDALGVLDLIGTPGVLPTGALGPRYAGRVFAHFLDLLDDAGSVGISRGSRGLGDRIEVRGKVLRSLLSFLVAIYGASEARPAASTAFVPAAAVPPAAAAVVEGQASEPATPSTTAAATAASLKRSPAAWQGPEEEWDGSFAFRDGIPTDFIALRFGSDGRLRPKRVRHMSTEQTLRAVEADRKRFLRSRANDAALGEDSIGAGAPESSSYLARLAASDRKSTAATSARVVSDRELAASARRRLVESLSEGDFVDANHMVSLVRALWPVTVRCWADCEPATRLAEGGEGGSASAGEAGSSLVCMLAAVDVLLWLVKRLFYTLVAGGNVEGPSDPSEGGKFAALSEILRMAGTLQSASVARQAVAKVRSLVWSDVNTHLANFLPLAVFGGSSAARINDLTLLNAKMTELVAHIILPEDLPRERCGSGDESMGYPVLGRDADVSPAERCLFALQSALLGFSDVKARKPDGREGHGEARVLDAAMQQTACGASLLRSLACVLPSVADDATMFDGLLGAFDTFMLASPPGSVTRHACIDLASAVVAHRLYGPRTGPTRCCAWATLFLRLVWELKGKAHHVADACLSASIVILDSLASGARKDGEREAAMLNIQAAARPLFAMQLEGRAGKGPKTIFGPFRSLAMGGQVLALRLLHALPHLDAKLLKGLALCLAPGQGVGIQPSVAARAVEIVDRCHSEGRCADEDFATFLATLLANGSGSSELLAWEECWSAVEVALRTLKQVMEEEEKYEGSGAWEGEGESGIRSGNGQEKTGGERAGRGRRSLLDSLTPFAEAGLAACELSPAEGPPTSDEAGLRQRSSLMALRLVCACLGVPWRLIPTRRDFIDEERPGGRVARGTSPVKLQFNSLAAQVGPHIPPVLSADHALGVLLAKALASQLLHREAVASRYSAHDESTGSSMRARSPEHGAPFALVVLFMPALLEPVLSALASFARDGGLAVQATEVVSRAALSACAATRLVTQMGTDGGPLHRLLLAQASTARAAFDALGAACGPGESDAHAKANLASAVAAAFGAQRPAA